MIGNEQLSIGPLEDDEDDGDDVFEPAPRNLSPRDLSARIEYFTFDLNPLGRAPNSAFHAVGLAKYHSNLLMATSLYSAEDLTEEEEAEEEEDVEEEEEEEEQTLPTGFSLTRKEVGLLVALLLVSSDFEPPGEKSGQEIEHFFKNGTRFLFELIRFGLKFSRRDFEREGVLMEGFLDPSGLRDAFDRIDEEMAPEAMEAFTDDLHRRALVGLECARAVFAKVDEGTRRDMKTIFESLEFRRQPFFANRRPEGSTLAKPSGRGKPNRPR